MQNSLINTYKQQIVTAVPDGRNPFTENMVMGKFITWLGHLPQAEKDLLIATFGASIPTIYLKAIADKILHWGEPLPGCTSWSEVEWYHELYRDGDLGELMHRSFGEIFKELFILDGYQENGY
jgi:hypothetical protein